MGTHYLTGYSIPKWRYIYNTTLVALDLLTIIAASGIVFLFRPSAYAYVRGIGPGEYGIFSFLALACASWLISLYAARTYERHTMGEGYALYANYSTQRSLTLSCYARWATSSISVFPGH